MDTGDEDLGPSTLPPPEGSVHIDIFWEIIRKECIAALSAL